MYDNSNSTYAGPGNGITGGNYDIFGADRTIPRSMTAFTAIAWFSALETLVLIFFVFKRYSGVYFWSILITTLGVIPYASGAWMKQNNVSHNDHFTEAILTIGWVIMVPGQSVVLYSRLHLISRNWRLIRFILCMIIFNTIVLCVPTSTLNLRQYTKHPAPYTRGYVVMEKIQMTIFTAQEVFISTVYLCEIRKVLQVVFEKKTRQSMWQLVAMNVLLLILDAALLTVEFMNFYMIETTFKSLVYAVKLKVEFGVLSQIVSVIQHKRNQSNSQTLAISDHASSSDEEAKPSFVEDRQIMQQNLPPEWRHSVVNSTIVKPNLLETQRVRDTDSRWSGSFSSLGDLYPGRLGY